MNNFVLEIFDNTGNKCTFYTVRWEDEDLSETDKFFNRYESKDRFELSIQELAKLITNIIGNRMGAKKDYFRFENYVHALPPKEIKTINIEYIDFPLRLYCLRLSENIVILFNGGEKTSGTAQGGKTSFVFHEANNFARKILEALNDKIISINKDKRTIEDFKGREEIYL